jgi:hypothetical protein
VKTITQTEAGFEARYQGQIVAVAPTEAEAREWLNTFVYDLERGRAAAATAATPNASRIPAWLIDWAEEVQAVLDAGQEPAEEAEPVAPAILQIAEKGEPGDTYTEYALGTAELVLDDGGCLLFADKHEAVMFFHNATGPAEMTAAQSLAAVRDLARLLSHPTVQRALGLKAPEVRLERYVSPPDIVGGHVYTGWTFAAGTTDGVVEAWFSDSHAAHNEPALHMPGRNGIPLHAVDRILPAIVALLNDPRVQEARSRWADGLPAVELAA